tara:strand:- start:1002 stop:1208 length:207 start_codon:yes stop_codon:yes gene_type:complete
MNNKAIIWIIVILIVLALGYFLIGNSGEVSEEVEVGVNLEDADDSAFENVETTDQILNEIDDSLNYLE